MTGKDFVALPAHTLPRFNAGYMPPGKSKNSKSVAKQAAAPDLKSKADVKSLSSKPAPKAPLAGAKATSMPHDAAPVRSVMGATAARPDASAPSSQPATDSPAGPNATRDQKAIVRREMRETLLKMRNRADRSAKICDAIVSHASWRRAVIVAIFAPMETEPDIEKLWKHAEGRTICYPIIRKGGLDFLSVSGPESVAVGQFGIREPIIEVARVIPPSSFDLILVPGIAFTAKGERLGRGGGFYDRVLSSPGFRAFKVGVCFDRQIRDVLPTEPHDQRVHRVVTEQGILERPDFAKKTKPAA